MTAPTSRVRPPSGGTLINHVQAEREVHFGAGEGFDEVGRQRLEAAALKGVLGRWSAETPNPPPPPAPRR